MSMGSRSCLPAACTLVTACVAWPLVSAAQLPDGSAASPPAPLAAPVTPATPNSATVPAAPAVEAPAPEAQPQLHENGRLAAILCLGVPLREQRCRFGSASGLVLTYHASGSVAEVLQFRDGWLDGLIEAYDAGGHLVDRTLYRGGAPQPMPSGPTSVQAPGETSLPLPPMVSSGDAPPPENAPTAPAVPPAPMAVAADVPAPRPPGGPLFGLGLRALVGMVTSDVASTAYTGAQVVFSPYQAGILPEFAVGIATTLDSTGLLRRLDVPMSLGYIWNLTRSPSPLYLTATFDVIYARRDIAGSVPGLTAEEAWMMGGHGGLGISLPLGGRERSWGRMLLDMRLGGTGRVDGNPPLRIPRDGAEPAIAMASQFRLLFTLTTLFSIGG